MKYSNNYHPLLSDEDIFKEIENEKNSIGYYNLVSQNTKEFKEYAKSVNQKQIAVLGIGGSTLGASAIYDFLKHRKKFKKELIFFDTTDPIDMHSKIESLNLKNTLFIVISKSGTTVETISVFKYLQSLVEIDKKNCLIISENDSKLTKYANSKDIMTFEIPKNVGGRFSVFSSVGLIPLAIVGVDIDELLKGAKKIYDSFFQNKKSYKQLIKKARFFTEFKHKFNINVVFSYSSMFEGFNKWYIQLWGESLGKIDIDNSRQGLTPIGLIGPIDQHSFLQLIVEGARDKTVTFIKVENFDSACEIPNKPLLGLENLEYLHNIKFSELINLQADATIEAIKKLKEIPFDVITINSIDENSIAKLMYEYELLTSICAKFLYINAYNQPGVEAGKIILKEKLKSLKEQK